MVIYVSSFLKAQDMCKHPSGSNHNSKKSIVIIRLSVDFPY